MKECELFEPVKKLFQEDGWSVNAEVKDCDITAVKNGTLIVIELKKNLSVALLAQALKRQKCCDGVYVAVPKPKSYSPKNYKDILFLIKKLELGLIFVTIRGGFSFAEIINYPMPFKPVRLNTGKRRQIIREIEGRTIDVNVGGVSGRKIATAYTEKCINIACILDKYGPLSPSKIRDYGGDEKCGNILRNNVYGWFEKVGRGIYSINTQGRRGIMEYPELERYYTERLELPE